jgi:hypothetical protein
MSHRTHRHVIASAAALAAAVSAATLVAAPPAAAAAATSSPHEFNGGYRQKLDLAGAIWRTETETSTESLELQVFEATEHLLADTPQHGEPTLALFYEHGEVDHQAGVLIQTSYEGFTGEDLVFDLDPSLRSGAGVRDTVELAGWQCSYPIGDPEPGDGPEGEGEPSCVDLPSATVQVDLTWTQTGGIYRDVQRLGVVIPTEFQAHARSVSASSNAVVTGEIAGEGLRLVDGPADFGVLIRGGYLEHLLLR